VIGFLLRLCFLKFSEAFRLLVRGLRRAFLINTVGLSLEINQFIMPNTGVENYKLSKKYADDLNGNQMHDRRDGWLIKLIVFCHLSFRLNGCA
jgi:hypothetical protein